jgi:hypothetical protein
MPYVYLLHFDQPVRGVRHYTGFARDADHLRTRIDKHRRGFGARLTTAVFNAGVSFTVARVWTCRTAKAEKWVKHRSVFLCPCCQTAAMLEAPFRVNAALAEAAD